MVFSRLIGENAASRSALNIMPEKIPKAMSDKFATIATLLASNPMAWMVQVNGFIVDNRGMPVEMKQIAFQKGLIPYVHAFQPEKDGQ